MAPGQPPSRRSRRLGADLRDLRQLVAAYISAGGLVDNIGRPIWWSAGSRASSTGCAASRRATGADPRGLCLHLLAGRGLRRARDGLRADRRRRDRLSDGRRRPGRHVFWPQHGEFANTTNFITSDARARGAGVPRRRASPSRSSRSSPTGSRTWCCRRRRRRCMRRSSTACFPRSALDARSGDDAELSRRARRLSVERPGQRAHRRRQDPDPGVATARRTHAGRVAVRRWSTPTALGSGSGAKLGQGGEGAVYELEGEPGRRRQDLPSAAAGAARGEDPRRWSASRTRALDKLTAWPIELLSLPSGQPIGVKMPRVIGHGHPPALQSRRAAAPSSRAPTGAFSSASRPTWRAPSPRCDAEGVVIADVNHGGILVAPGRAGAADRLRQLPDRRPAGSCFPCDVGVPIFTPPELQDRCSTGVMRSENHDNFGLAVMIFLVLFMGRHPFAGRYLGEGDMPIERAIREHRFAYGAGRASFAAMEQPPGTPPLAIVSPPVAGAVRARLRAREPRPGAGRSAVEWIDALETLAGSCGNAPSASRTGISPACRPARGAGSRRRPACRCSRTTVSRCAAAHFDLPAFWQQLVAIEHPGPGA